MEVGTLMNNAALNEEDNDGDKHKELETCLSSLHFIAAELLEKLENIRCCRLTIPPLIAEAVAC